MARLSSESVAMIVRHISEVLTTTLLDQDVNVSGTGPLQEGERLLDMGEAATLLNISRRQLRKLLDEDDCSIPHSQVGSHFRFEKKALWSWWRARSGGGS